MNYLYSISLKGYQDLYSRALLHRAGRRYLYSISLKGYQDVSKISLMVLFLSTIYTVSVSKTIHPIERGRTQYE